MSIAEGIKREELQEMAKAILSEIYEADRTAAAADGGFFAPGTDGIPSGAGHGSGAETAAFSAIYGGRGLFGERASETEDGAYFAYPGAERSFRPRTERREFLEQRILRRASREGGTPAYQTADARKTDAPETAEAFRKSLAQIGLPEELSDIYRKDSRRYDGAFEKY